MFKNKKKKPRQVFQAWNKTELRSSFYIWYFKFDLPVLMKESTTTVNLTLFRVFGTADLTSFTNSEAIC
jgi:hypothetical protein